MNNLYKDGAIDMIFRIIATFACILGATFLYTGLISKSKWWNAAIALVLGLENAAIFSILRFLATPLIWITFGAIGLVLNFVILVFMDKLLPGITFKNYAGVCIFSLAVSVLSAAIYWLL